jgi:hypothetical protein
MTRAILISACCLFAQQAAWAYVDLAPTLARIAREAETITVAEVSNFSSEKGIVILKKISDLKGKTGSEPLRHQLVRVDEPSLDAPLANWAEPGRRCVIFTTGKAAVVCIGEGWYQANALDNGWWRIGAPRPDLPLAFYGSVSRLTEALPLFLAGKSAVITALPHGANREGASFDLALHRASLPGFTKVQRLRIGKGMPEMAMGVGANPAWVVGMGRVSKDELPALRRNLNAKDAMVRADSAVDIGYLGPDAAEAANDLVKRLDDQAPKVRLSAAASLLRVAGKEARAVDVLAKGLADENAAIRRDAARSASLAGAAAAPLADKLASLLKDSDPTVVRTALLALAALGPAAATACEQVTPLLDRPETATDAADALGRMGPGARASLKALARLLDSKAPAQRWAAVRAMSQIGGPDAAPAVKFMIRQLPRASEDDGYNMLIYLSLLGPVAKEAIPAIRTSRVRNPILRQTTEWAISPSADLPSSAMWGNAEFLHYIHEAYVHELGDHLKPAAEGLARKIMTGKAGNVPSWGYKMLARFPDESLAILKPGLSSTELVMRERATVAIGYMGRAARAARPSVAEALKSSADDREQLLLQWCLRELE